MTLPGDRTPRGSRRATRNEAPPTGATRGLESSDGAAIRRRGAQRGEDAAAAHLERLGYRVLARNLRLGHDEIDLLAVDPDERTVVVVEVKFRARPSARPEDRVDATKRHRLSRAALQLSTKRPFIGAPFRFDVISVVESPEGPLVEHWRSAFDAA